MMKSTDILYASLPINDANAVNIKDYFIKLLEILWIEGEGFSGKRPFGNSGWEYDLTIPLVEMGYAENYAKARLMIHDAINSL